MKESHSYSKIFSPKKPGCFFYKITGWHSVISFSRGAVFASTKKKLYCDRTPVILNGQPCYPKIWRGYQIFELLNKHAEWTVELEAELEKWFEYPTKKSAANDSNFGGDMRKAG